MGVFKLIMSFIGDRVRRAIPEAGLLGSIGGVGIALLGTLQLGEIYSEPIVGMMALGIILYALVAKIETAVPRAARCWRASSIGVAIYYATRRGGASRPSGCKGGGEFSDGRCRCRR